MVSSIETFSSQVVEIMPLLLREFIKRESNDLVRGNISFPQMVALDFVAHKERVTMTEIAKVLSIRLSSATALIDRMIRQKFMTRQHDNKDRRVVWIAITPRGKKVVSRIMEQKRRSIKTLFAPLTHQERNQYLAALLKVKVHLTAMAGICALMFLIQTTEAHAFLWFGNKAKQEKVMVSADSDLPKQRTLTLQDAFQKALKRSEQVAITAEEMNLAQARFYRSFDYFLPSVNFEMTRFQQDVNDDSSGGTLDFGRQTKPEKKFVFSQPLFSGFKEIAALQATGADKESQRLKWKRAKEMLFVDVAEAYYSVRVAEKDKQVLYSIRQLMAERLKDLKDRVELGRSRESEQKTSLADLKIIESDLVDAKRKAVAAMNLLEFYTGEDLDDAGLTDDNEESTAFDFKLANAQKRADVVSSENEYVVAQKKVIAANAHFFPTIGLNGNYYTQRVGIQEGNDWDVTLKFDVPVFEVGQTLGDVKEAAANREKARLVFEEKKRLARLEAKNSYEDYLSAKESEEALGAASRASQDNYKILQSEFGSNLVNNLEVLDSLRRYEDVQRRYEAARVATKIAYWKLRAALGDIPGVTS